MFVVGIFYHIHGDHALVTAALKGVAAAAVGLILSTVVSLSKKSLSSKFDFVFIAMTVIAVNRLHLGVPRTLVVVGILAILFHYPRKAAESECDAMNQIPALIRVFSYLSILTVGGGMAAFPEMKILTVDVHHWLDFKQLIHLYSVGQMAPGPNMMMIVSIGQWAGGTLGAIAVLVAFFGPTAILAFVVAKAMEKAGEVAVENLDSTGSRAGVDRACCWPAVSAWQRVPSPAWKPAGSPLPSC